MRDHVIKVHVSSYHPMIVLESDPDLSPKSSSSPSPFSSPLPGPSTSAAANQHETEEPSTFVAQAVHSPANVPQDPPPAFAPYDAAWFEVGQGDVVSHDEHLNVDGEALYRFLLTQADKRPPSYRLHCKGTHTETRYRFVSSPNYNDHHHSHNHNSTRTETYTECVTDFDFYIDITPPYLPSQSTLSPPATPQDSKGRSRTPTERQVDASPDDFAPTQWSVADHEPAYRGKVVREIQMGSHSLPSDEDLLLFSPSSVTRRATRQERNEHSQWSKQRTRKGLPPWVTGINNWDVTYLQPRDTLKSSKSIRQWADEYCASPKLLKEFVYTKVLYGWDISQLETAIRSTITLAPYQGDVQVTFTPINSKVYIRPSNRLSRALSNKWLKFLSIILFIFPFIWLFKRFHSKGGGRWEVCGSAYALKKLIPLNNATSPGSPSRANELPSYDDVAFSSRELTSSPSSLPSPTLTGSIQPTSAPLTVPQVRIVQTQRGPHKLIGQREGEWFRRWESFIIRAVLTRYQSNTPLTLHSELYVQHAAPGSVLDGYHDIPNSAPPPSLPTNSSTTRSGPGGIFLP